MAIKKNIIAFGQIASVAAQTVVRDDNAIRPTCIIDLQDLSDAQLFAKDVFEHHKHGDAYLFLYSNVDDHSLEYAKAFEQFILVDREGEHIPHALLEVAARHALDDEAGEELINRHLGFLSYGVKNSHEHRNQKNGFFDVGWFTPGTVFGYYVSGYGSKKGEMIYLTADHVITNAPNSFCVVTTTDAHPAIGGKESVNISHVKTIALQAPGRVKWGVQRADVYRKEFFEKESLHWHLPNVKAKHPSQYRTHDPRQLILHIATPMVPHGQLLDIEKMTKLIVASNVFKRSVVNPESQFARLVLHTVNKKRLKSMIRRVLNKCLGDVKQAAADYETMLAEIDNESFEREREREERLGSRLSPDITSSQDDEPMPYGDEYY
jgi:hypothetical protein